MHRVLTVISAALLLLLHVALPTFGGEGEGRREEAADAGKAAGKPCSTLLPDGSRSREPPLLCRAARVLEEGYDADMLRDFGENLSEDEREMWGETAREKAEEAVALLEKSLKEEGSGPLAWGRLSQALGLKMKYENLIVQALGLGRFHEAMGRALSLDPGNLDALLAKGYEALETPGVFGGDIEEARGLFKKAAARHPRSGAPLRALGEIALREKKYGEAARLFEKAALLDPGDLGAVALGRKARRLADGR